jgi:hypothetical protein
MDVVEYPSGETADDRSKRLGYRKRVVGKGRYEGERTVNRINTKSSTCHSPKKPDDGFHQNEKKHSPVVNAV